MYNKNKKYLGKHTHCPSIKNPIDSWEKDESISNHHSSQESTRKLCFLPQFQKHSKMLKLNEKMAEPLMEVKMSKNVRIRLYSSTQSNLHFYGYYGGAICGDFLNFLTQ